MSRNLVRALQSDMAPESGTATARTLSPRGAPPLQFDNFMQHYGADPERKWQVEVLDKLLKFVRLPPGWDGYGSPAPKWDAGLFALSVLNSIMRPRTPLPQIVPTAVGGVQLEWHEKDIDLELHITAPYRCEVWFEDHRDGTHLSDDLSADLSALGSPIEALTLR